MMKTVVTFTWPDGRTATLSVQNRAPEDYSHVIARGSTNRLPAWPNPAPNNWLETWARQQAPAAGATLSVESTGAYSEWAE